MPSQGEVKRLNKDVVLAIDWAASEYKYVKELQQELEKINVGKEPLKNLRKASKILHYISRAERRADRFEERARKKIEEVSEELEKHLEVPFNLKDIVTALREIAKELTIERAHLVRYSSLYGGLLEKELNKAAAEAELEKQIKWSNPERVEQIHTILLQLVHQIEYQIKDAEKWISALDASLKKAQQILKELPREDKDYLLEGGLVILHKLGWPYPDKDKTTLLLAQHPSDLEELGHTTEDAHYLFSTILPVMKNFISEKNLPIFLEELREASNYFPEMPLFFPFMENLLILILKEKIDVVYAIDRSGRILGFLLYHILRDLGLLKGLKFYFILGSKGTNTPVYSEKQKREIVGKKILLIDEYISTGETINLAANLLRSITKSSVFSRAFSSIRGGYGEVTSNVPSWYWKKEYSGLAVKEHGEIEVDIGAQAIARDVRKSLLKLAKIIAKYLKCRGYYVPYIYVRQ